MSGIKRLQKEYRDLVKDPIPNCVIGSNENNILECYFLFKGDKDTPYYGGIYMGKLLLPKEYPWKPPQIFMITPNGRFRNDGRPICTSFSHYHPESWNPALCIRTMIIGFISFFYEEEKRISVGGIKTTITDKTRYANLSTLFNRQNATYLEIFSNIDFDIKPKVVIIKKKMK